MKFSRGVEKFSGSVEKIIVGGGGWLTFLQEWSRFFHKGLRFFQEGFEFEI